MDVTRELASVERTVSSGSLDARALRIAREQPAPPERVWDMLTTADGIPLWLASVSGDLRVGGRYQLEGNAGGDILACTPARELSVTWEYDGETTRVDVHLSESEAGTHLELIHTGAHNPARWEAYGPGAVGIGWEMAMLAMSAQLRDVEGLADWFGGPKGVDFVAGSGAAWGEAAVAAGEDPDQAKEAAARCVAAYTAPPPDQA